MYYDRQGHPLDAADWLRAFEGDRTVARTQVGDAMVSTVFLGLDHNWGQGPPLIFETMVFGGPNNEYMLRYSTESAALAGHDQVVSAVRDGRALT